MSSMNALNRAEPRGEATTRRAATPVLKCGVFLTDACQTLTPISRWMIRAQYTRRDRPASIGLDGPTSAMWSARRTL